MISLSEVNYHKIHYAWFFFRWLVWRFSNVQELSTCTQPQVYLPVFASFLVGWPSWTFWMRNKNCIRLCFVSDENVRTWPELEPRPCWVRIILMYVVSALRLVNFQWTNHWWPSRNRGNNCKIRDQNDGNRIAKQMFATLASLECSERLSVRSATRFVRLFPDAPDLYSC